MQQYIKSQNHKEGGNKSVVKIKIVKKYGGAKEQRTKKGVY